MSEEWRPVVGYEGLYEVSDLGNVRSMARCVDNGRGWKRPYRAKEKALQKNNHGYLIVGLYSKGKAKLMSVHRLVAEAFIPNPENKAEVNHIDGNKTNNCVWNLEWATRTENACHSVNVLKKNPSIAKRKAVRHIETGKVYPSLRAAEAETGIWASGICRVAQGKAPSASGTHWEYA